MRLQGKAALITGAASGMGRSEALLFAREGAAVAVTDILEEEGHAVVDEIASAGGAARFFKLDVTNEGEWKSVIATAVNAFGNLEILINNAGISGTYDLDLSSTSAFDLQMNVNAKSVFLGMKHGRPALAVAGGGAIVNSSSISASVAQNGVHMGYSGAKAAVSAMTRVAALQFAGDNIRVNCVAPGMLPPMRTSRGSVDPRWRARALEAVPMRRDGRVEEVATTVLFLASDEASYITGAEIAIDGGYMAV